MTVKRLCGLWVFFILCTADPLFSQVDTTVADTLQMIPTGRGTGTFITADTVVTDSLGGKKKGPKIRPKKPWLAAVFSATLPGAGQIYNRKYWKAPIVWGALGTCGYFIVSNHIDFIDHRNAYRELINNDVVLPGYESYAFNPSGLRNKRDNLQRTRDLVIIIGSVLWALNVVDAVVDAHLSTWDVSEDLSFSVRPATIYLPETNTTYGGLSFSLQLRNRNDHKPTFKF